MIELDFGDFLRRRRVSGANGAGRRPFADDAVVLTVAQKLGRELGVRYVLEGTVRRLGNQVRVSVQLIDAETDKHLWADRLDSDGGDAPVTPNSGKIWKVTHFAKQ